jgi:hypothetical protein
MRLARATALTLLTVSTLALAGCQSIYFHNGVRDDVTQQSKFHHIGVFSLVEFSDPVDLSERCPGGWRTVNTELSFLNAVVGMFTQPIYGPWTVKIGCER